MRLTMDDKRVQSSTDRQTDGQTPYFRYRSGVQLRGDITPYVR